MLERILDYSRKVKNNEFFANKATQVNLKSNSDLKAGIDLALITFNPSHFLWQAQLTIYLVMLVFAFIALLPFFLTAFYWILLWLAFALFIGIAIHVSWNTKNAAPISVEVKQNNWRLKTLTGEFAVTIHKEVVLWSWLIVLPLREKLTGKQYYLVALPDSLNQEDWRRISVWLRNCL